MRQNAASRIDRIMVPEELIRKFPDARAFCKGRMFSDHYPIILVTSQIKWGPTPFRSLDVWLSEPSFLRTFKKEWVQLEGLTLEQKLKRIKKPLKAWNKAVSGHIDYKI